MRARPSMTRTQLKKDVGLHRPIRPFKPKQRPCKPQSARTAIPRLGVSAKVVMDAKAAFKTSIIKRADGQTRKRHVQAENGDFNDARPDALLKSRDAAKPSKASVCSHGHVSAPALPQWTLNGPPKRHKLSDSFKVPQVLSVASDARATSSGATDAYVGASRCQ